MAKKFTKAEVQEATDDLKKLFVGRQRIYAQLCTRSKSGMQRTYKFYMVDPRDMRILYLTYNIGIAAGFTINVNGEIVVKGCGFSGEWHIIDQLAYVLYGTHANTGDLFAIDSL